VLNRQIGTSGYCQLRLDDACQMNTPVAPAGLVCRLGAVSAATTCQPTLPFGPPCSTASECEAGACGVLGQNWTAAACCAPRQ
jgi:hypothetical protein